jgi:hypothetical protein
MFSKKRRQAFAGMQTIVTHTVTKEDLTLTLGRAGIRLWIGLTHLEVGLNINVGAFLQVTKEIVGVGVERKDVMPRGL